MYVNLLQLSVDENNLITYELNSFKKQYFPILFYLLKNFTDNISITNKITHSGSWSLLVLILVQVPFSIFAMNYHGKS